jgi:hypothetical protein
MAQLYPQPLGFLSFTFYNSQGYGEGILMHLHKGKTCYEWYFFVFSKSAGNSLALIALVP